ncbi:hypothetical protein EHQ92_07710 [Leptospira biflexa]|jgi:hypothetical protein|uniref:hypothetical protein n=1 Tax=Leptospira biflexa TaxID=172 RepID=UPI001082E19A|nr:hypothetical protein [Leptospira biflexa]TGM38249.1 hypothetical protein EHQ80_11895 [Leptospira biflexa]TGM41581.1 hypothetical protein EHQ89_06460 [Leptospira biflexa]TGM47781.1 hypothetical protein EHQ92_07710 [Leptospira biflexa]TGM49753.1 hypothetical protein EHQ88_05375 [Leptospira biflexa]TGM55014.1 hypothetical protein EHQ91_08680 [Leptospira biflexa]
MRTLLTALTTLLLAGSLSAQTYTVFIHGKSGKNHNGIGTTDVNSYWGSSANSVSGNRIFIGYDGTTDPRTYGSSRAQSNISTGLTNYCKSGKSCKIVCHSAGCYAIEYWLSNLGSTASAKGFNITKVTALAAASGGSELANALNGITFGFGGNAMDKSLIVTTARGAFNHNNTGGVAINHVPGYKGMFGASAILPGEDDYAVAYHSSCAYNRAGGLNKCQSSLTQYEGLWPFGSNRTYKQYSGHYRAPSVSSAGLYLDHGQIKKEGWR